MAERSLDSLVDQLQRVAAERDKLVPDGALLDRFLQTQDPATFELIVWRHGAMVQAVCRQVLGHSGDVDDAFQATFLVLLRRARSIRNRDSLAGWLHGVAFRLAHRCRRTLLTRQRHEQNAAQPEAWHPPCSDASEIGPIIHAEIDRLPERLRRPFVLCEIEGRTDAEAAALLAIPYGTVISRLSRARQRLRRRLIQRGVTLGAAGLASVFSVEPVSAALVSAAVKGVLQSNAGSAMAGPAATLAKGVVQAMFVRKMKTIAVSLLAALVACGVGVTVIARQMESARAAEKFPTDSDQPVPDQSKSSRAGDNQQPAKPAEVAVTKPVMRTVTDYLFISGHLKASSTVVIRPRVSGMLAKIAFKDGAEVQQGQILFEIDSNVYRAELDRARSAIVVAEARVKLADATAKRMATLHSSGNVGQDEVDKAAAERTEAEAAVFQAKSNLEQAQRNIDLTHVTAPISGQIGQHLIDPGNVVKADETKLAEIINAHPIYVYCDISERMMLQIRALQNNGKLNEKVRAVAVGLASEQGFTYPGLVDFLENQVNPQTGLSTMRIAVPNQKKMLLPGMAARVRLTVSEPHEAMLVPWSAVRRGQFDRFVLVVGDKNKLEQRTVQLGNEYDGQIAITKGLTTDDRVIVQSNGVEAGMIVKPRSTSSKDSEKDHPPEGDER
jgi:RND family efflux transporter MFP subunit